MRFIRTTTEDLELALDLIHKKDPDENGWVAETWESFYVIRTKKSQGGITLSRPDHAKDLGIYFQPRIGTSDPVILLGQTTEIYRVEL